MITNDFLMRLSECMQEYGLSQLELSRRLQISQAAVSRWFTGSRPRPAQALKLAAVLGVHVEWLLTGRGDKATKDRTTIERKIAETMGLDYNSKTGEMTINRQLQHRKFLESLVKKLRAEAAAINESADFLEQELNNQQKL